jgi:Zn-dependent peptidase ImmA (M78 family)
VPVPVDSIAADLLGLHVEEVEDLHGLSGVLLPHLRAIWLSAGEARESPGRRRFTLAHEIGHWVCHCATASAAPAVLCRAGQVGAQAGDPVEREANVFAAELLMPEAAVADAMARGAPPAAIAAELGVSDIALAWRLYNLGLEESPPA